MVGPTQDVMLCVRITTDYFVDRLKWKKTLKMSETSTICK